MKVNCSKCGSQRWWELGTDADFSFREVDALSLDGDILPEEGPFIAVKAPEGSIICAECGASMFEAGV